MNKQIMMIIMRPVRTMLLVRVVIRITVRTMRMLLMISSS